MSRSAQILEKLYQDGKVSIRGLAQAVEDWVISKKDFETITGERY